jgi:UDP-GlcNAc:undecaprenyl-phosphate GlcNAc-1-phosphate transferase
LAVFLTCTLFYAVFAWGQYPYVAAATAAIAILGFLDDRLRLRPSVKLLGQSICVLIVLWSGVVFHATPWNWFNVTITFLWIAGVTNAFNLIDNMDGLCAGVAIIISVSRILFGLETGDPAGALLSAALGGAFVGFLVFNYKPAKIFMGDCGSMFAGFALGALAIASPQPRTRVFIAGLFYPALTFLYPLFDTILVSVLRRAAGRPVSVGGRDHSSHRLVSLGLSEHRVLWLLWGLAAVGSAAGLCTYWLPFGVLVISALLVVAATIFGVFLGTLPNYAPPETAPVRSHWWRRMVPTFRATITVVVDVLLSGIALLSAFLVRWEDGFAGAPLHDFEISLPVIMVTHAAACIAFRTFNLGWRWFGSADLIVLVKASATSAVVSLFTIWMFGFRGYSRGVIVLYAVLSIFYSVAVRALLRFLWDTLPSVERRRAAILGAGVAGELAVLLLQHNEEIRAKPVMILDPDPAAAHMRIHGVPVYSTGPNWLETLVERRVEVVVVVESNGTLPEMHRELALACRRAGIDVRTCDLSLRPALSIGSYA